MTPTDARTWRTAAIISALAAVSLAGCAGPGGGLTPQQREAVETRRYCEAHGEDVVRCLGFLGDH
ncbi:MAG: hypothetical protein MUF03_11365 [Rubrivivax sp.]|jgi:hypothetical protein|nr:hypothetical protein [Rubrivivax sp.]